MQKRSDREPAFFVRLWLAMALFFRVLFDRKLAERAQPLLAASAPAEGAGETSEPPQKLHASGLFLLSLLQREGRLIDFVEEEIGSASDAEVGAAARIVHAGCRKVLKRYLALKPVMGAPEGSTVSVPQGFDANRIRLVGNVAGNPPFSGSLKHHGWVTQEIRLPPLPEALDATVLAPAEVELS
jgi:hypothetical protein